jgi:two-component system sensor histidine kinase VicK
MSARILRSSNPLIPSQRWPRFGELDAQAITDYLRPSRLTRIVRLIFIGGIIISLVIFQRLFYADYYAEATFLVPMLAVLLCSWLGGIPAGLAATGIFVLTSAYFVDPTFHLFLTNHSWQVKVLSFVVIGVLTSTVNHISRQQTMRRTKQLLLERTALLNVQSEELQTKFLSEATSILASTLEYQTTLKTLAQLAVPLLADWCVINMIYDSGELKQVAVAHKIPATEKHLPVEDWVTAWSIDTSQKILQTGVPQIFPDFLRITSAPALRKVPKDLQSGGSAMVVPLKTRNRTVGTITLMIAGPGRTYVPADLEFARDLAMRAALALDNARLFQESQEEIARRQAMESAVRQSRDQLEGILETVPDGITVRAPDETYLYVNNMAARLLGYANCEEMTSAPPSEAEKQVEIFDENGDPLPPSKYPGYQALKGKSVRDMLLRMRQKKSGEVRWVSLRATPVFDRDGNVQFATSVMHDVTGRYERDVAKQKLAAVVESSEDAITTLNLEGIITSWNQGAEKLYGYRAREMNGKSITLLIPPEHRTEWAKIMEKMKKGQAIDNEDQIRLRKDGKQIIVSASIAPIKDRKGKIIGASTIARDVTALRELDQRKDEFIAVASHELKTPITSIRAYSQLLERRLRGVADAESRQYITKMTAQMDRLTELVMDLLDVTKMRAGRFEVHPERVDVDRLVRETVETVQKATTNHRIIFRGSAGNHAMADRKRVGQVMTNLIANAVKFSPAGKEIIVRMKPDGDKSIISVEDYGIGIKPAEQQKIFERYYQAAAANKDSKAIGAGLGLYISSEIIKKHGGKIWVESKPGKGSTFSFTLPHSD